VPTSQSEGCVYDPQPLSDGRSTPCARAFTSAASARSKIQAMVCHQLLSPKMNKKNLIVTTSDVCCLQDFHCAYCTMFSGLIQHRLFLACKAFGIFIQ